MATVHVRFTNQIKVPEPMPTEARSSHSGQTHQVVVVEKQVVCHHRKKHYVGMYISYRLKTSIDIQKQDVAASMHFLNFYVMCKRGL